MMPASDRAGLDVWYGLSFGREQAHATRSLADPLPEPVDIPGVIIRPATLDDRDAMVEEMSPILRQHLVAPPVWAASLPEYMQAVREGFAEMLEDDTARVWLAAAEGIETERVLGYQAYFPAKPADDNLTVSISDRTIALKVAATRPDVRGRGIGRALTRVGLAAAAAAGYRLCITDWRTANVEAARFWPQMGFQTVAYRLTRKLDPRVMWATG
jgi:GNAT superfamily N-acetyltransferase